jgi:hypothetical protein
MLSAVSKKGTINPSFVALSGMLIPGKRVAKPVNALARLRNRPLAKISYDPVQSYRSRR